MNKTLQTLKYVFADYVSASLAWSLFYLYRKFYIEPDKFGVDPDVVFDKQYTLGMIILPISWVLAYYLTGFYKILIKSRGLMNFYKRLLLLLLG